VDFLEEGTVDVRVYFCGEDGYVPEHLLYGPQVGTAFKQVRGKGVPERVGVDLFCDAGLPAPLR
jgi:hypothetical protein